jgi:hypothetical protein
VDFEITDIEERTERGIVLETEDRGGRRRRHLEYAAEIRRDRSARERGKGTGREQGRKRSSRRRKSASGAKPGRTRETSGLKKGRGRRSGKPDTRRRRPTKGPRGKKKIGR